MLMPEVRNGNPPSNGSGKFGTPCERMQSAYLTFFEYLTDAELFGLDADPQAAIASVLIATAMASSNMRRRAPGVLSVGPFCMSET